MTEKCNTNIFYKEIFERFACMYYTLFKVPNFSLTWNYAILSIVLYGRGWCLVI